MEFAVLKDIVVIFALSTLVNYIFTRIRVPTIIGYLVNRHHCRSVFIRTHQFSG